MKAHLTYLSYILRHKWYVFLSGLKTRAPLWRLIIHDWSKFTPLEWSAYVNYFHREGGKEKHAKGGKSYNPAEGNVAFNIAWLKHQHRNPHHWQHWVLSEDSGNRFALPMPEQIIREMVADWRGAGMAQGFFGDLSKWYNNNKHIIILHEDTRVMVERLIDEIGE